MTSRDNLISKPRLANDERDIVRRPLSLPVRAVAKVLLVATLPACLPDLPPLPTKGYGEPYKGTGKPIYVKDGRSDWQINEGARPVTSEQALEAVKDEEYETRRQAAKKYNEQLFEEGKSHRSLGKILLGAGGALTVAGFGVMFVVPSLLREETVSPASAAEPERRVTEAGGASNAALAAGLVTGLAGIGLMVYGYLGGKADPPYHVWKTPSALNRPAYIREKTEPYNESIGAPPVEQQPGSVESVPLAPGQRKPPPERPTAPKPRASAAPAAPASSSAPAPATSAKPGTAPAPATSAKPAAPAASAAPATSAKPPTQPVAPNPSKPLTPRGLGR